MRLVLALAAALLLTLPAAAQPNPSQIPGDNEPAEDAADTARTAINDIAYADGALWVRTFGGALRTGSPADGRLREALADGVADIVQAGDRVLVLHASGGEGRYEILSYGPGGPRTLGAVSLGADGPPLALTAAGGVLLILTDKALYRGAAGQPFERVALQVDRLLSMPAQATAVLTADGRALYLGLNAGEWGGDLVRIDPATGKGGSLGGRGGRFCDILRDDCPGVTQGPVTALLADPRRPDCMLAAGGLSHMGMTSGRLVRVCPSGFEVLFTRKVVDPMFTGPMTEPVFALAATADGGWWAATDQSLVRMRKGRMTRQDLPEVVQTGDLYLGRVDRLVVVASDVNRRQAVLPGSPLIAAME